VISRANRSILQKINLLLDTPRWFCTNDGATCIYFALLRPVARGLPRACSFLDTAHLADIIVTREAGEVVPPVKEQPTGSIPKPVDQLREEMRQEARALDQRLQTLGRDVEALRARLGDLLASWERQIGEAQIPAQVATGPIHEKQPPNSSEAGVDRNGAPSQTEESSEKIHRDAMRYARLLVSEIELYNKELVAQGRVNKDLYSRLKPHIDRSRRAYESRFSRAMTAPKDYFHEELVRTLAYNDFSLLGSDYPAPHE